MPRKTAPLLVMAVAVLACASPLYVTHARAADSVSNGSNAALADVPQGNVIGTIISTRGLVAVSVAGLPKPVVAANAQPIHPDDIITTGPRARVFIQMIDDTQITLGDNSQLTFGDYAYDEADGRNSAATYTIGKGTAMYVAGKMAQSPDADIRINVPAAEIRARGTKLWAGILLGDYGVLAAAGDFALDTGAGRARLAQGQGVMLREKNQPPGPVSTWDAHRLNEAAKAVMLKTPPDVVAEYMKNNVARNEALLKQHQALLAKRIKTKPAETDTAQKPDTAIPAKTAEKPETRITGDSAPKTISAVPLGRTPDAPTIAPIPAPAPAIASPLAPATLIPSVPVPAVPQVPAVATPVVAQPILAAPIQPSATVPIVAPVIAAPATTTSATVTITPPETEPTASDTIVEVEPTPIFPAPPVPTAKPTQTAAKQPEAEKPASVTTPVTAPVTAAPEQPKPPQKTIAVVQPAPVKAPQVAPVTAPVVAPVVTPVIAPVKPAAVAKPVIAPVQPVTSPADIANAPATRSTPGFASTPSTSLRRSMPEGDEARANTIIRATPLGSGNSGTVSGFSTTRSQSPRPPVETAE